MTTSKHIIMSAASVSAALSAIGASAAAGDVLPAPISTRYDNIAEDAVASARSQALIRASMMSISRTIRIDQAFGEALYAEVAQTTPAEGDGGGEAGGDTGETGDGLDDSTIDGGEDTGDGTEDPDAEDENPEGDDVEPEEEPEPEIIYDENGIPEDLVEDTDAAEGDDGFDEDAIESENQLIDELGLQVPEGMTQEEYIDLLDSIYAEIIGNAEPPQNQAPANDPTGGSPLVDSTNQGGIFNCYSNCHAACHGSRGWR